jgi:hypothetical protein
MKQKQLTEHNTEVSQPTYTVLRLGEMSDSVCLY